MLGALFREVNADAVVHAKGKTIEFWQSGPKTWFPRAKSSFRFARHPEAILGKRDYVGLRSGQQGSNLKAKLLARRGSVNGGAGYHGFQDAHPGDLLGGDLQGVAVEDDEVGEFAGFEGAGDVVIM